MAITDLQLPFLGLKAEKRAEALRLDAADGDFSTLLVVHAELKAGLEPGDNFANAVDVDRKSVV